MTRDPCGGYCFNCNQPGHVAASCPSPAPTGLPEGFPPPLPPRRPPEDIADAGQWAAQVRRELGWTRASRQQADGQLALRQVAESRRERGMLTGPGGAPGR